VIIDVFGVYYHVCKADDGDGFEVCVASDHFIGMVANPAKIRTEHFPNRCGKLTSFFIWHFIFKEGS
jgi:hypothetical protein